jgi:hypothetical protein
MLPPETMKCLAETMAKKLTRRAKKHSKADRAGAACGDGSLVDDADERRAEAADA